MDPPGGAVRSIRARAPRILNKNGGPESLTRTRAIGCTRGAPVHLVPCTLVRAPGVRGIQPAVHPPCTRARCTWSRAPGPRPPYPPPMPSDSPPVPVELLAALRAYARTARAVEGLAGSPADARPVFVLDARTLRARADRADPLARAELARREARHALHRAAELAALAIDGPPSPLAAEVRPAAPPPPREAPAEVPADVPPAAEVSAGGVALRAWREGLHLSQATAAERLDVPRSTWAGWESGRAAPGRAHWPAIERVTGIPRSTWGG